MGALPKRKISKARGRKRRAQWMRLHIPNLVTCPECGRPKRPHHVCMNCGTYRGEQVIEFAAEE